MTSLPGSRLIQVCMMIGSQSVLYAIYIIYNDICMCYNSLDFTYIQTHVYLCILPGTMFDTICMYIIICVCILYTYILYA